LDVDNIFNDERFWTMITRGT